MSAELLFLLQAIAILLLQQYSKPPWKACEGENNDIIEMRSDGERSLCVLCCELIFFLYSPRKTPRLSFPWFVTVFRGRRGFPERKNNRRSNWLDGILTIAAGYSWDLVDRSRFRSGRSIRARNWPPPPMDGFFFASIRLMDLMVGTLRRMVSG